MNGSQALLGKAARQGQSDGARAGATVARRSITCAGVLLAVAGWVALFAVGLVVLLTGVAYLIDIALADRPLSPVFILALLIAMLISLAHMRRRPPP
jgi:energy-converting hydrogenase Eha subunit C